MRIRPLKLKRDVSPENAPLFAQDAVATTARITGDELDYSVASLAIVDRIIERIRSSGGTIDQYAETMFVFGCYVGEVFVRNASGRWVWTPEDSLRVLGMRIVLDLPQQKSLCNPIAKAFKRLHNGVEENLPFFYSAFTRRPETTIEVPPRGAVDPVEPGPVADQPGQGRLDSAGGPEPEEPADPAADQSERNGS